MKRSRFNNLYMSYIGKSRFNILKIIIPIIVFIMCLVIYIAKISTALSIEKNEDAIETVVIPNTSKSINFNFAEKLDYIKVEVLSTFNKVRSRKRCIR